MQCEIWSLVIYLDQIKCISLADATTVGCFKTARESRENKDSNRNARGRDVMRL